MALEPGDTQIDGGPVVGLQDAEGADLGSMERDAGLHADLGVDGASDAASEGRDLGSTTDTGSGGPLDGGPVDAGPVDAGMGGGDAGALACDPNEQVQLADALFVSASAGRDNAAGDAANPLLTLGRAISIASERSQGTRIYVDEGVYRESIAISNVTRPLRIEGGWRLGSGWRRQCDQSARTRTAVESSSAQAVEIRDSVGLVTLKTLSIHTPDPCEQPMAGRAESCIGVLVHTSEVILLDLDVVAGDGGRGRTGADGARGALGTPDRCGRRPNQACTRSPQAGAAALPGVDGPLGALTELGFTPGDGLDGPAGTDGTAGTPGGSRPLVGGCFKGCNNCTIINGTPVCATTSGPSTATDGLCGCGGGGGAGGQGGGGGGASVALHVSGSADVQVFTSRLVARNGGAGAPGGAGGDGGAGGTGERGMDGFCDRYTGRCEPNLDAQGMCSGPCTLPTITGRDNYSGGAAGGSGFEGGRGGQGGAGAGGSAWAAVRLDQAQIRIDGLTVLEAGAGGAGAGDAPDGQSALRFGF